jgi:hypothetical protein
MTQPHRLTQAGLVASAFSELGRRFTRRRGSAHLGGRFLLTDDQALFRMTGRGHNTLVPLATRSDIANGPQRPSVDVSAGEPVPVRSVHGGPPGATATVTMYREYFSRYSDFHGGNDHRRLIFLRLHLTGVSAPCSGNRGAHSTGASRMPSESHTPLATSRHSSGCLCVSCRRSGSVRSQGALSLIKCVSARPHDLLRNPERWHQRVRSGACL